MPHAASSRAALRAVVGLATALLAVLLPGLGATGSTPDEHEVADPLLVHLDAITPVLPRRGTVDISGTVTNTTDAEFTRVNLHAFTSASPIVTATSLADSTAIPPEAFVGERVTDPGTFATVETLVPGQTAAFSVSVPVELLDATGEPGVFWIGVHALGDSTLPRDASADGRARTFIPALPRGDDELEAAVILPLRSRVWYQPDGRLGGTDRWARWFAEGGRLDTALDIADAAGDNTYTWLVDPAILDAVHRLTRFNPPRSLAPDPAVPGQEPEAPNPDEEPTDDGSDTGSPTPSTETLTPPSQTPGQEEETRTEEELALAAAAASWLERFRGATTARPVLALPFGDLDVSAAVRNRPERYDQARERSAQVMAELEVPATPALAPENDVLSPEALAEAPADTTIVMADTAFAPPPTTGSSVVRLLDHQVVVTSAGAQSGGPSPTRPDDALAMRQRLLSEAALRVADGSTAPVVVTLPSGWSPEDAGALFSAFEEPWLSPVSVADVASRQATDVPATALTYTEQDAVGELDAANFLAADRLSQTVGLLEEVLTLQTTVQQQVADELLVTLSQQHRARPRVAQRSAAAIREHIVDQLASIRIEPIPKVVLSSSSGPLGATLVNGLDQPVSVNVGASSDGDMTLDGPGLRRLGPQARSVIRLEATATRAGVHNVRLRVESESGIPLGSSARFPIRAAQVSGLIWVVMAAGAALLLSAAALRVWRRVRGGDAVPADPGPDPGRDAGADAGRDAGTPRRAEATA